MLRRLSDSVTDWENEREVFDALNAIVDTLHIDKRDGVSPQNAARDVFKQMKGQSRFRSCMTISSVLTIWAPSTT